jgi:hypothetical protein
MKQLRLWFCRQRTQLMRWSLVIAAAAPVAAWSLSKAFAVDGRSIMIVIASALYAVWRPYRDSWLRQRCGAGTSVCASH